MKKELLRLYYFLLKCKDYIVIRYNQQIVFKRKKPLVVGTDETLIKILNDKCSVSRFGDGEFALMYGEGLIFQPYRQELSERLNEIIRTDNSNHIVCIPNIFDGLDIYTPKATQYWKKYLDLNYHKIYKRLDIKKQYYDTQVTRLYIDTKVKSQVKKRFDMLKELWKKRDIIIVEGEKSRLGTGNDLFTNTKVIERVICPAKDAFAHYSTILNTVNKHSTDKLILIALGPTATVLAYDLARLGYQAIDIGHIDIEYEWFLQGATEKCPVKNKYIGEIEGGIDVKELEDVMYEKQIIAVIK